MTNLEKEKVQSAISAYCMAKGISAKELAVKADVSTATISNMKNGKWDNIDSGMWKKVNHIVNPDLTDNLVETKDLREVFKICDSAIKNRFMIGLLGDTGMGKTTSLKGYASTRKNVYYTYIDATVTPKIFLTDLLREMCIDFEGSLNAKLSRVAAELNTATNPLLLIDECGKLSHKMILCIHALRDKTKENCGIVLSGMPDFKNTLVALKSAKRMGYGEFFRRVNMWHELTGLSTNEITYIIESNGITDKSAQQEFRRLTRFGDLVNEITLHQTLNA